MTEPAHASHGERQAFADDRDVEHAGRLTGRFTLALPARTITLSETQVDRAIGYAGLTAATLLGVLELRRHGMPAQLTIARSCT